jgi:dTDP-4-amino-4,6-dideoxygalactose transaminase
MFNTQFSPWPCFSEEEVLAVAAVLRSNKVNYWTGTECRDFEREFAAWTRSNYAIALSNGTLALDLALKGLGIGSGDEVIVTPRTYIASVSCVITAGATPIFADVDKDSGNLTAATISERITPRTKAVICVHLGGWPCDMDPIMELARVHGFKVIEDCAQAHGAQYKGRSVGSIGHIGTWSFCQDKIMTTGGEGGMVTTDDESLWRSMWAFKDHGKSYSAVYESKHPPGFRWLHESFGTNWRMLEMQAVIGRIQLKQMSAWLAARTENAKAINLVCQKYSCLRVPNFPASNVNAYYKYYVHIRPEYLEKDWSRDRVIEAFTKEGIPCFQGSCSEVYLEKAFDNSGLRPLKRLENAKNLGETSLVFLVHPSLTKLEINQTCQAIDRVMLMAQKK